MKSEKKIFSKFVFIFLFLIAIPILAIILISNELYTRSLVKNVSKKAQQNTEQIALNVNDSLVKMNSSLRNLGFYLNSENLETIKQIKQNNQGADETREKKELVDESLNTIINFPGSVETIILYFKDGTNYSNKRNIIDDDREIRNSPWYKHTLRNPMTLVSSRIPSEIFSTEQGEFYVTFSYCPGFQNESIEMISVVVNLFFFNSVYEKSRELNNEGLIVSDYNGNIMTSSMFIENSTAIPSDMIPRIASGKNGYFEQKYDDKRYIITYSEISFNGWILINFTDYQMLENENKNIMIFMLSGFTFLLLGFLFLFYRFFEGIVRPINAIVQSMDGFEKASTDVKLKTVWGAHEFNSLSYSFVRMSERIKLLIHENEQEQEIKRKLEITALQYQINPHFIKNALNSIRLLALLSKVENIANMSQCLSNIISSSIEDDSLFSKISKEVRLLKDFIYIMQIRYINQFIFECNISDEIEDLLILKNILQPLAENSIFHGLSSKSEKGLLRITGFLEKESNLVIIEIYDNGCGISEEKLNEIVKLNKNHMGIGLYNVFERMRLNYGEKYKPKIESVKDSYTKIILTLPIQTNVVDSENLY